MSIEVKEYNKRELALKLFEFLKAQLEKENMKVEDLRAGKKSFLVSHRTMKYLESGELKLKPKRTQEICDALGLKFYAETKFFLQIV